MKKIFFALMFVLISPAAQAEYNKLLVDNVILELEKLAAAECVPQRYFLNANKAIEELNLSVMEIADENARAKKTEQLREAYSGFREATLISISGERTNCARKVQNSIDALRKLPTLRSNDPAAVRQEVKQKESVAR